MFSLGEFDRHLQRRARELCAAYDRPPFDEVVVYPEPHRDATSLLFRRGVTYQARDLPHRTLCIRDPGLLLSEVDELIAQLLRRRFVRVGRWPRRRV